MIIRRDMTIVSVRLTLIMIKLIPVVSPGANRLVLESSGKC